MSIHREQVRKAFNDHKELLAFLGCMVVGIAFTAAAWNVSSAAHRWNRCAVLWQSEPTDQALTYAIQRCGG